MSNSMVEQMRLFVRLFLGLSGLLLCHAWPSAALADEPKVIVGKDNWLFFSQEVVGPDEQRDIDTSIDLIGRLNSLLQANGVQMPSSCQINGKCKSPCRVTMTASLRN